MFALLLTFSFIKRGYAQSPENFVAPPLDNAELYTISAYYSPLPNQSRYVTGSYESDVRLNGEGVHAADSTIVYEGMIAAPKEIPFGTKIYIEGIGMGTVHDRGGSIKGKRLDVWMGYGEEGMGRALGWGIRRARVKIYDLNPELKETIDLSKLPVVKNAGFFPNTKYFKHDLGFGDEGDEVTELQRLLKELGYTESALTGIYNESTSSAVLYFQMEREIIDDPLDPGAGLFGPRTRYAFEKALNERKAEEILKFPKRSLGTNSRGEDVDYLEKALMALGYLNSASGIYNEKLIHAVFRFQKDRGIVLRENEYGAGTFGPQTREALKSLWLKRFTPDEKKLEIPERNFSDAKISVFKKILRKGDKGEDVERLQEELYRLNFLRVQPTGNFREITEHAVFKFQQAMGILDTKKDSGAGIVGPKTREKLHSLIARRKEQNRLIAETTHKQKIISGRVEDEKKLLLAADIKIETASNADLSYGMKDKNVRELQKLLKTLGYFQGYLFSDYYGDFTRKAVFNFQKAHGLVIDEDDEKAGIYDENTRRILEKIVRG